MINLTIKAFDGQSYELTSRSGKPKSSAAQLYRNDPYLTQRFVARLPIEPRVWLQILQRSSHSPIAYSSNHPAEIHQAVAKSIMRGDLKLYKLPRLDAVRSIRGKQDMGLCIIQGPQPHSASNQSPVALNSPQAARELLNELGIAPQTLLAYLEHQKLYTSDSKGSSLDKVLNQLAKGELLAYKIPMPPMAPPAKKLEMVEATGPAYEPVPFGPEPAQSRSVPTKITPSPSNEPTQKSNLELDDKEKINRLSKDAETAKNEGNNERSKEKIAEAREILLPYVVNNDLQGLLNRLDVDSPENGAYFWSGWPDGALTKAQEIAGKNKGVSLETTMGGRIVNDWKELNNSPISGEFWTKLSEKYAGGASGNVEVIQSNKAYEAGGGKIWKETELPTLVKKGKVNQITLRDLNGETRECWDKNTMKLKVSREKV